MHPLEYIATFQGSCPCWAHTSDDDSISSSVGDAACHRYDNWSLRHVPLKSESVRILPQYYSNRDSAIVHIPENYEASIYTLDVESGVVLNVSVSAQLNVLTDSGWIDVVQCDN